jgi:hypothetical protein
LVKVQGREKGEEDRKRERAEVLYRGKREKGENGRKRKCEKEKGRIETEEDPYLH